MEKLPFVDDIKVKNCLTGILIRSPVPSGMVREIKTPKLPYNTALITAADIPGKNRLAGPEQEEIPIFPEKKLSWYGQPAALLLGPDPARLRELAEQCAVITEEIPDEFEAGERTILERKYQSADDETIETTFKEAASVVEGNYTTGIADPWPSDPPGALAVPGQGILMLIHTASQWPGHVRHSVAGALGVRTGEVEVRPARLEVHLDSKIWFPSLVACQAAVGAWARGKPVKLILNRKEDFFFSPKSVEAEIRIQSALDKEGRILGTKLKVRALFGAAGIFAEEILDRIALGALGSYGSGKIFMEAQGLSRPLPPGGPVTGFGMIQGFFAAEQQASRIACAQGEDPLDWRKTFFLRRGNKLPAGVEIREEPPVENLLDSAAALAGYRRKWAACELLRKSRRAASSLYEPLRGIGISLAYQGQSLLYDYLLETKSGGTGTGKTGPGIGATLDKDGVLEIRTSFPWKEDQRRVWLDLAASILGVETIRIVSLETDSRPVPESGPACLSRGTIIARLVESACLAIRKQRFRDPLPISVQRYYHPSWKQNLLSGKSWDENALSPLSWGAAVVEAEIDPVDLSPRTRGMWLVLDGGTVHSEERERRNAVRSALQALSWAAGESTAYRDGKITGLRDYPLPLAGESPPVNAVFLGTGGNPRGTEELPFLTVPAAYAQALSQALDYPFEKYPVNREDIWRAVQNLGASSSSKEEKP